MWAYLRPRSWSVTRAGAGGSVCPPPDAALASAQQGPPQQTPLRPLQCAGLASLCMPIATSAAASAPFLTVESYIGQHGQQDVECHNPERKRAVQALAGWHLIAEKYAKLPLTPLTASLAIEDAAMHTHKVATRSTASHWLQDESETSDEALAAVCSARLDCIAQEVREQYHSEFGCAASPAALVCQTGLMRQHAAAPRSTPGSLHSDRRHGRPGQLAYSAQYI
jgi:hypothetical protein